MATATKTRINRDIRRNDTVVVTTENPTGKLLPYLTATLRFETGRRTNVLLVPNAALRGQP